MGRKLEPKEKGISLSLFYLKYFLYLFIVIAVISVVALLSFNELIIRDMLYPADYAQQQANIAQTKIEDAITVNEDIIPELCQYVVFDLDGNVISGNIGSNETKTAWKSISSKTTNFKGNVYKVIKRYNEYCVLQYKITPQYKSETLRKYLCPPQTLIIVSTVILIFLSVVIIAIRFGSILKKKMNSLIVVTEKIQKQDLDFSVEKGNIKEINTILGAMDKMRKALKYSLESQWKAEQSQKEQLSALAHDLKTPLTIVRGNAEILYDTNPTKEQFECIDYINESSLQMQDYIKMLIEITKSNNIYSPQIQEISVIDFVQDIEKQAKGLCSVRDIQLKWEFRSKTKYLFVDPSLLERALNNVLSNAIEHSISNGIVTVVIYDKDNYITFSISDNGKGFSKDALKHAQERFYMDDQSRGSKFHFGMGLYITSTIVKQLNGKITLKNSEETHGAQVIIKIPL